MNINEATIQMWIDELGSIKNDVSGLDKFETFADGEIDDALFDIDNQFDLLIMKMERTIG